jgi:hypothetical protein
MNIEAEKAMIIEKVKQVNDVDLIRAIKSMLDFAQKRDQKVYDIPEAHQNLAMERFDESRKNSERLLDWAKIKETLKTK